MPDETHTKRRPTTSTGLPIEDQVRKEMGSSQGQSPTRKSRLPRDRYAARRSRVGRRCWPPPRLLRRLRRYGRPRAASGRWRRATDTATRRRAAGRGRHAPANGQLCLAAFSVGVPRGGGRGGHKKSVPVRQHDDPRISIVAVHRGTIANPASMSAGTQSLQTRCWRELDSNYRFRARGVTVLSLRLSPQVPSFSGGAVRGHHARDRRRHAAGIFALLCGRLSPG